jgi:ribosome biogenesis GTPase / thiamine phosphate phosphatase
MSHSEEEYFTDRKEGKRERKAIKAKDRSKYKKTDQSKYLSGLESEKELKLSKENLLEGRVLSITSQGIYVDYQGQRVCCSLKGLLKKDKTHLKNLVTVGDLVLFEIVHQNEGIISKIQPRYSILSRADNLSRRKEQIIASNIDQVLITTSVVHPPIKPPLIDRYIIAATKGNMRPVIIVNKIDLLDDDSYDPVLVETERELYRLFLEAYQQLEILVIPVSVKKNEGLDALREIMKGKTSVFSGQSGVGKSSLINAVTGTDLKTGGIVDKTNKGSHTTSTANLIPLEFGGWCIDTPGIRSFGVWNLKKEDVQHYFSEIYAVGRTCKFPDCTHTHEEECAVIQAVEGEVISEMRYESYVALVLGVGEEHLRR